MLMRVLTGIVAAGVVLAGITLWRTVGIRRVRWIIAGLAGYGAVAFLHAMLTGITLRAALSGHGLFQPLPYVLQGAFIGGFIVLPLGWIASIARAGIPRFRKGSLRRNAYQVVALTTCVAMLSTSIAPANRDSTFASHPMDPKERAAALDRSLRAVEDADRESPRDRWDPDYVIRMVGRDPQQLFDWVRDNTYWIPYRGVLRGPAGVLMDGQGNSLDRSLLLAALLEKTGQTVRLAHGELTEQQAFELLPSLVSERAVAFTAPNQTDAAPELSVRAAAAQYQLDVPAIERTVKEQENAAARISAELEARVADQSERLLRATQGINRPDDLLQRFKGNVAALRDHWWVQRQEGQKWVDLDSSADDGAGALASARETLAVKDVAADLHHEITVRVVAEQWSAGTLSERKALEHTLRPADLIGQTIVLQLLPTSWLDDSAPQVQSKLDLRAAVLDQNEWAAGLLVGGKVVASGTLRDDGDDAPVKGGDMGGLGAALANSLSRGRANKPDAAKKKALSAVWLEYEIHVPGEKPRTLRRTLFDLLGPAVRSSSANPVLLLDDTKRLARGLSLATKTEILPLACQLAPEFVAHLTAESLAAHKDLLRDIAGNEFSPRAEKTKQQLANATPPATPLLALAFARLEWSRSASYVFLDRPNILTRHQSFVMAGNEIALQDAIDIVANEVAVDLTAPNAFAIRLQQGVRDTNGEALLGSGAATGNTGEAFAALRDWLTVVPGDRSALDTLTFSADVRRRMSQDLDEGYVVVAPRGPLERRSEHFAGWWRINPHTGDALGVDASGWGQSMVERGRLTSLAVTFSRSFLFEYGLCQSIPQAVNSLRVINEELFGGWNPSWTKPGAKSVDPLELADKNHRMCLVQAIASGFIATLPLLLITLKYSRSGRWLAFLKRVRRGPRPPRPPRSSPRGPCLATLAPGGAPLAMLLFFAGPCGGPPGGGPARGPHGTEVDPGAAPPVPPKPGPITSLPTAEEVQEAYDAQTAAGKKSAADIGEAIRYSNQGNKDQLVEDALRDRAQQSYDEYSAAVDRYKALNKLFEYFGPGSGGGGGAAGAAGASNALKGL